MISSNSFLLLLECTHLIPLWQMLMSGGIYLLLLAWEDQTHHIPVHLDSFDSDKKK